MGIYIYVQKKVRGKVKDREFRELNVQKGER